MTDAPDKVLLLTVEETATALNISKPTVFKLLKSGDLASMTIGAKRLIPRQEVDRFIGERTGKRPAPTSRVEPAL